MTTSIRGGTYARKGGPVIRSSGGMAILDETYHYIVQSTVINEEYLTVITTPGLPLVNITVSPSGYGICKTKSATMREDNPSIWDVQVDFSSEVDERQDNHDPTQNPEAWIPIYETKFERLQEVVTKDKDDDAIANSAGQPFENGMTVSRFIPIWEFFQLESGALTDEEIIERNETVNETEFKGRAPKTLLLTVMSSVVGFYYGQRRRLTQYSLRYNNKKWTHKRLDVGTVYLDEDVHKPYTDDDGNVILGGLDGEGGKVTPGDPPAILEFDKFAELNFNSFLRI